MTTYAGYVKQLHDEYGNEDGKELVYITVDSLPNMTKAQLQETAKRNRIKNYSQLNKADLVKYMEMCLFKMVYEVRSVENDKLIFVVESFDKAYRDAVKMCLPGEYYIAERELRFNKSIRLVISDYIEVERVQQTVSDDATSTAFATTADVTPALTSWDAFYTITADCYNELNAWTISNFFTIGKRSELIRIMHIIKQNHENNYPAIHPSYLNKPLWCDLYDFIRKYSVKLVIYQLMTILDYHTWQFRFEYFNLVMVDLKVTSPTA